MKRIPALAHKNIVVYQVGLIGDTVVSIPALQCIRRNVGSSVHVTHLHQRISSTPVTPADVLRGSGLVDEFLAYEYEPGLWKRFLVVLRLWRRLSRAHYDIAIYLGPSGRSRLSVIRDRYFMQLCNVKKLIGFHAHSNAHRNQLMRIGNHCLVQHEAVLRLARLGLDGFDICYELDLSKACLQIPPEEKTEAIEWLAKRRKYKDRPLLGICPGANKESNLWPIERFIILGNLARPKFEIVVIGGINERHKGLALVSAWGEGINACGELTVLGSAALLKQCSVVVGLDTGTTHLAGISGAPLVAIYGGQDRFGRWIPLGKGHIVLRHPVDCSGCRLVKCTVHNHPCMTGIPADRVYEALELVFRRQHLQHKVETELRSV